MADKTTNTEDKYKDKNIRFYNKDTHYELIIGDSFNVPMSDNGIGKQETNTLDIIMDLKEADKSKELHIFIGSYGGYVHCLNMFLQHILEFEYRVGINLGMADSCGFMLLCCCNEIYASPWSEFMYHSMSSLLFGKVKELKIEVKYLEKWWNILMEHSFVNQILTKEELKLGETTQVFLTGQELIDRHVVQDYSFYKDRVIPTKINDEFYLAKDTVYRKVGNHFVKYTEDKSSKKKKVYQELLIHCNQ